MTRFSTNAAARHAGHPGAVDGDAAAVGRDVSRSGALRQGKLHPLEAAHSIYKQLLAPILRAGAGTLGMQTSCCFQPTCSDYAVLALAQHGPLRGTWLAARRLLRCHPFSRGGWDPVPCLGGPQQAASSSAIE